MTDADFLKTVALITVVFVEYFIVKYALMKLKDIQFDSVVASKSTFEKKFSTNNKKSSVNVDHVEIDTRPNFYIEDVDSSNLKSSSEKGEVKTKAEKLRELRKKGKI